MYGAGRQLCHQTALRGKPRAGLRLRTQVGQVRSSCPTSNYGPRRGQPLSRHRRPARRELLGLAVGPGLIWRLESLVLLPAAHPSSNLHPTRDCFPLNRITIVSPPCGFQWGLASGRHWQMGDRKRQRLGYFFPLLPSLSSMVLGGAASLEDHKPHQAGPLPPSQRAALPSPIAKQAWVLTNL